MPEVSNFSLAGVGGRELLEAGCSWRGAPLVPGLFEGPVGGCRSGT